MFEKSFKVFPVALSFLLGYRVDQDNPSISHLLLELCYPSWTLFTPTTGNNRVSGSTPVVTMIFL